MRGSGACSHTKAEEDAACVLGAYKPALEQMGFTVGDFATGDFAAAEEA